MSQAPQSPPPTGPPGEPPGEPPAGPPPDEPSSSRNLLTALAIGGGAIILAVVLFLVLRPDDSEPAADTIPTSTAAPTTTVVTTTSQTTTQVTTTVQTTTAETTTTTPDEGPQRIDVRYENGEVVGGVVEADVDQGAQVLLIVRADVEDEVHVHGYDLTADVAPGQPARIRFRADVAGKFEVELENLGVQLAELTVNP